MTTEVTQHRETSFGESTEEQTSKLIEATVDTDSSGNGSLTVDFSTHFNDDPSKHRRPFDGVPWVFIEESSDPATEIQNVTQDAMDIVISGSSTTDGTVTVRVFVVGVWSEERA